MPEALLRANAKFLQLEIAWFRNLLDERLERHASGKTGRDIFKAFPPPDLTGHAGPYVSCIEDLKLERRERLLLMLALLPHAAPHALDPFFIQNNALGRPFTEFGGTAVQTQGAFMPTGETAMFMLTGHDLSQRLLHADLFSGRSALFANNVLSLAVQTSSEPHLSAPLQMSPQYREKLLTGQDYEPQLSAEFPAQRLTTPYEWDDLVLDEQTREEVEDIVAWIRHEDVLMKDWKLGRRITPGYRSLFYGPPGTGKTLTAGLLGKAAGVPVYRIDLSKIISKYFGETEKNMAQLFDQAQCQNWILFFDEADSLFGKRTEAGNASDRAVNQNISYLLQRIESYDGVVLLATNLHSLMDDAFSRRFQSIVHFKPPNAEQRRKLWQDNFSDKPFELDADIDLTAIAQDYDLTGGNIINVLRYVCLKAVARRHQQITLNDILHGIQRERHKEGKYSAPSLGA